MSASSVTVPTYWPKPNYVNPESRKGGAIAYNTVLMVVVVTVVSLRYYSRVGVLKQRLGCDDFFIGLSLVSSGLIFSLDAVCQYCDTSYAYTVPMPTLTEPLLVLVMHTCALHRQHSGQCCIWLQPSRLGYPASLVSRSCGLRDCHQARFHPCSDIHSHQCTMFLLETGAQ